MSSQAVELPIQTPVERVVLRFSEDEAGISVLYNGLPYIVSLAGLFEFYCSTPGSERITIASGPWSGSLRSRLTVSGRSYILSGDDMKTGGESNIKIKQVNKDTIEIRYFFVVPRRAARVAVELLKLSGELAANARVDSNRVDTGDAGIIPAKPLPPQRRFLLRNKNRIIVRSAVCDVEIVDIEGAGTLRMADFRNVQWDSKKSIYVGADRPVEPSRICVLAYRLKISKPSNMAAADRGLARGNIQIISMPAMVLAPLKKTTVVRDTIP